MDNLTVDGKLDAVDVFMSVCGVNVSDTDSTGELWVIKNRAGGIVSAVVLLLYFLVGLPLNATVLGTVLWKRLYKCPTTMLLLNLVINDLIILVLFMPLQITTGLVGEYIFGSSDRERCTTCKYGVISYFFLSVSIFTITLLSLDRFLFLYRPLRYGKIVTPMRTLLVLAVLWLANVILILISALGIGNVVFFEPFLSCTMNFFNGSFVVFFLVLCVPAIVLTVCNVGVVYIVLRNIRTIYKVEKLRSTDPEGRSKVEALAKTVKKKRHEKQVRFVYAYGGLLCSTFIGILPLAIFSLVVTVTEFLDVKLDIAIFVNLTFYSQVCVHPILETWLMKGVREPIKALLKHVRTKFHLCLPQERGGRVLNKYACHCCKCNANESVKKVCFLADLIQGAMVHGDTAEPQIVNNHSNEH